jgi:stage IV sporulation protein FB
MFETGYFQVARIGGAPIRVHWSILAGALVFSGFEVRPGAWVGFVLLILLHELGHAALVTGYGLRVVSVDLHGLGGLCRWAGEATPRQRAVIAWGGVTAQLLVLGATYAALALLGPPTSTFAAELAYVFVKTNEWLIAINLLPVPPLDGAQAWAIFRLMRRNRSQRVQGTKGDARREVRRLEELDRQEPKLSREDLDRINRLFKDANKKGH